MKSPDYLNQCPRQKDIVEFLKKNPGASESEILLNVYNVDRRRGHNNKAGADAVRRALRNGFITRKVDRYPGGVFKYFAVKFGAIKFVYNN